MMYLHKDTVTKIVAHKMGHAYDTLSDDSPPAWTDLYTWACDELGIDVDYLDIDDEIDKEYWDY